jgi:YbgC/YbaW family acyl-CoA thioester hydrolase
MKRQEFRFFHRLRVRWAEVDMQRVVFNAHYLMYFDVAITEYWRALALPYDGIILQLGSEPFVRKATVEFNAPARMDDDLDVAMRCSRVGNSSMVITGAIFRGDEHLIGAELVYVFADPSTQTSRAIPQSLRDVLQGFEAGQPVLQLHTGSWQELGRDASLVRTEVFVQEQGVPVDIERDTADADAVHVLATNGLGQPVATGRLLQAEPGVAKVGRMAVHRILRGTGVGAQVLQALEAVARQRGDRVVRLSAQSAAQGFYRKQGYTPNTAPFEEAGIPHVGMEKRLTVL